MSQHVVIIGAGPGGLAAAMLLAKAGVRTTVVEAQDYVGGRTSTLHDQGYQFDRGPTFFLYPRILNEIFATCGYDLFEECPMARLDPQYRLVFGEGGQLDATPNVERMEAEVARFAPGNERGLRPFLAENRKKLDHFQPILEAPFYKRSDLLRPEVVRSAHLLRPWRSLYNEVGRHFKDPRLKLAFTFQGKYLGMSPFQCPSLFSILAFLEYEYGVFHPMGGCGAVSERMAQIVRELGGEVLTGQPVESIQFNGRRAVGVTTPNGPIACDALVINADFAQAMHSLVPNGLRRRWTDAKLEQKRYSCSTFMLYLGLEGQQPDLPHHTIYLSKSYQENLLNIESRHRLDPDPSFYVQNASVTDPSLAPPGDSTLYMLVPTSQMHANIDWTQERDRFRALAINQLRKIGLEDVERRVRVEHVVTPADWQNGCRIFRGATFNLAHNLGQMLYWRPHNRFEDLDGVYLVGGGTHPGSGLPTIYSSARITTDSLLADLNARAPIASTKKGTAKDAKSAKKLVPLPSA